MTRLAQILVVDDDRAIVQLVATALRDPKYQILTALGGAEALALFSDQQPDLVILDLAMPEVDGIMVCRAIRRESDIPIIILSAQGDEVAKVQALDLGADDYLTKPFGVNELRARVRAVLRRAQPGTSATSNKQTAVGNLEIYFDSRRVMVGERQINLTPTEYALLVELVRNVGKVLTHDMLLTRVWGQEYRGSSQYLHIYVGRLRSKLEGLSGAEIVTESGVGYWLREF